MSITSIDTFSETINAVTRFTNKKPLVCTRPRAENTLSAALWQHTPKKKRFEGHHHSILGISLRGNSHMEQLINGRTVWRGLARGSIILLNADEPSDWELDGQFEMLHIYLDSKQIPWEQKSTQLTLPFRDPVLFNLASATASALTNCNDNDSFIFPLLDGLQRYLIERYFLDKSLKSENTLSGLPVFSQKKIESFINEYLAKEIHVEELAEMVNLSPGHFSRAFKETYSISPHQFLIEKRISRACELLRETDLKVHDIASETGFSSASHLGTHFKKMMTTTPNKFRR